MAQHLNITWTRTDQSAHAVVVGTSYTGYRVYTIRRGRIGWLVYAHFPASVTYHGIEAIDLRLTLRAAIRSANKHARTVQLH